MNELSLPVGIIEEALDYFVNQGWSLLRSVMTFTNIPFPTGVVATRNAQDNSQARLQNMSAVVRTRPPLRSLAVRSEHVYCLQGDFSLCSDGYYHAVRRSEGRVSGTNLPYDIISDRNSASGQSLWVCGFHRSS